MDLNFFRLRIRSEKSDVYDDVVSAFPEVLLPEVINSECHDTGERQRKELKLFTLQRLSTANLELQLARKAAREIKDSKGSKSRKRLKIANDFWLAWEHFFSARYSSHASNNLCNLNYVH